MWLFVLALSLTSPVLVTLTIGFLRGHGDAQAVGQERFSDSATQACPEVGLDAEGARDCDIERSPMLGPAPAASHELPLSPPEAAEPSSNPPPQFELGTRAPLRL